MKVRPQLSGPCIFVPSVKLDSKTRHKGWIDEYPSFIAIAWHGPVYEIALRYIEAINS